jgi:hypothetical protein
MSFRLNLELKPCCLYFFIMHEWWVGEYFVVQNTHHESNQVPGEGATRTSMLMVGNFSLKSLPATPEPKCLTPKALPYTLCFEY